MQAGRIPHAILMVGDDPRALQINGDAAAGLLLQCDDPIKCADLSAVHPVGKMRQISIDSIRELIHRLSQSAAGIGLKLTLITDADRMHRFAANALLKILEEPPRDTIFLLTTSHLYEVLPTIRSRCLLYRLRENGTQTCSDEAWQEWLSQWRWLVENITESPREELFLEAYALIHNFQALLDGGQPAKTPGEGEEEREAERRFLRESRLRCCAQVLFQTSMDLLPKDVFEKRKAVCRLARRLQAIETASSLLALNYGESAAIEFFVMALFSENTGTRQG
jgi:DNA polymerase-3 subunit delta'